jgi:hypothetical protein
MIKLEYAFFGGEDESFCIFGFSLCVLTIFRTVPLVPKMFSITTHFYLISFVERYAFVTYMVAQRGNLDL